ncbi:MAG TPA: flavin reductase family protein [Acidimicrobiales bacterium]|nr:flavin reductase family protein [Acidimicrobiales bacterium]
MSGEITGPVPAGADPDAYDRLRRRVLWSMPSGLYLIGSRHDDEVNLMTANWVTQVAVAPKLVAVSVDHLAVTRRLIEAGRVFSVSLLARADRTVVRHFVKPVPDVERGRDGSPRAMAGEAVVTEVTGAPILARAAAWLDCSVRHRLDLGSHVLFVGEVMAAGGDGDGDRLRMEDTKMSYGG